MRQRRKHTCAEREVTHIQRRGKTAPLELGVGRTGVACAQRHMVVHRNPGQAMQPSAGFSLCNASQSTRFCSKTFLVSGMLQEATAKESKIRCIQAACELSGTSSPPL